MTRARTWLALLVAAFLLPCCRGGHTSGSPPAEPGAGHWRTWALPSPSSVRVPAPPRPGSPAGRRDRLELERAVSRRRPADQADVQQWAEPPVVRFWLTKAMDFVSERPKDPPAASRAYALVSVAAYDATVASWHWKYVYGRRPPAGRPLVPRSADPSYPDAQAAIAGAASRTLEYAFPEQPRGRLERWAEQAAWSRVRAGASYPSDVAAGLALGRVVARRAIARVRGDDRLGFAQWDGRRPRGRGYWAPPPGSAARPVEPLAGRWHTWVLRSGRELRPGPPPRIGSPQNLAEGRELIAIQRHLTPRQRGLAKFWEGGEGSELPPGIWDRVLLDYVARRNPSVPGQARAFALLNVAMADAGVASWDAKYTYWYPRPVNAIRDLGLDRHWNPFLLTPFFPAYVSGHSTYSAAAAEVLSYLFPEDAGLWRRRGEEAGLSRLWGGIHWPSDHRAGRRLGLAIGHRVVQWARHDGSGP